MCCIIIWICQTVYERKFIFIFLGRRDICFNRRADISNRCLSETREDDVCRGALFDPVQRSRGRCCYSRRSALETREVTFAAGMRPLFTRPNGERRVLGTGSGLKGRRREVLGIRSITGNFCVYIKKSQMLKQKRCTSFIITFVVLFSSVYVLSIFIDLARHEIDLIAFHWPPLLIVWRGRQRSDGQETFRCRLTEGTLGLMKPANRLLIMKHTTDTLK